MKTKKLDTYAKFIKAGRPYLPVVSNGVLYLPCFSVNNRPGASHKKRLICCAVAFFNRPGFQAVYSVNISRYGKRERFFYWRDSRRITWWQLTYDERVKVLRAYVRAVANGRIWQEAERPCHSFKFYRLLQTDSYTLGVN